MNVNMLKVLPIFLFVFIGGLVKPALVRADAMTDIQVFLSGGKLATGLSKYVGVFDEMSFETHDPGFAGALPLARKYGVQLSQKLWYHSGIEGDPVTPVPGNVFLTVSDSTSSITVTGSSGLQTGLLLTESLSGSLHAHLDFALFPNSGPTAAVGVYGLVLQITSPSYEASDPFLLAIANLQGLDILDPAVLARVEYGEQAIFNAAVPEPSSIALAGLGIGSVAFAALRRRMRKR